jgi:hypothetical protein
MSIKRIIVGELAQSKTRGKAASKEQWDKLSPAGQLRIKGNEKQKCKKY